MGKMSREKGKSGEREVARILQAAGYDARRSQQFCGKAGDADVVGLPGVHVEVKRVEALRLYDALSQAKHDAREGEMPVVVHRKNNCPWVVIQPLEDWLSLYREWESGQQDQIQQVERTCTPVYQYSGEAFPHSIHVTELSCGHEFRWYERGYTPNYCPNCGAKVVS